MSAADNLRRARARIATPETWCTAAMARTADGSKVEDLLAEGHVAVRFCAIGALAVEGLDTWLGTDEPGSSGSEQWYLEKALAELFGGLFHGETVEDFNDDAGTTHAGVLAMYDRAIAFAEAPTFTDTSGGATGNGMWRGEP